MDSLIYLDNAATTAVKPEVFEQMMPYFMDTYSNPASVYSFAGKAKKAVDDAREQIANALNAKTPAEVYFTGAAARHCGAAHRTANPGDAASGSKPYGAARGNLW